MVEQLPVKEPVPRSSRGSPAKFGVFMTPQKAWKLRNPEKVKATRKLCYQRDMATNPEKLRAATRKWRKNNPRISKHSLLLCTFGIGIEEYEALLQEQKNVCAICSQPESSKWRGKVRYLSVDHCHKTGKIRGLLCSGCNTAIGLLKDSTNVIARAYLYLYDNTKIVGN